MTRKVLRITLPVGGILVLVVVMPLVVNALRDQLVILGGLYGYVTAFLIGAFTNATILLPTPTLMPTIVEIAERNNFVWVAGVYAAGSALGESTAYFAGHLFNQIPGIQQNKIHQTLKRWMKGRLATGLVLFLLAAFPITPFDIGGAIAGNANYPYRWFLSVTFTGRWIKYLYTIPLWGEIEQILSQVPWIGDQAWLLMLGVVLLVLFMIYRKGLWAFARAAFKDKKPPDL